MGIKRSEAFLFCKSKRELGVKNDDCELKFTRHKRLSKPATAKWSGDPCIFCKTKISSTRSYSRRTHSLVSSQRQESININEVGYMTRNEKAGISAHYNCLFFTPGDDMIQDPKREPEQSLEEFDIGAIRACVSNHKKRKCCFCHKPGAVSTCANKKCKKTGWYHFPCGLKNGSVQKDVDTVPMSGILLTFCWPALPLSLLTISPASCYQGLTRQASKHNISFSIN